MATQTFLTRQNGQTKRVIASTQSAGAADAGKIPALDSTGRLDMSMMPAGIGQEVDLIPASEALDAGNFVNIWSDSGAAKVRKADNSNGRPADGFVLAGVAADAVAEVYPLDGVNSSLTGLSPGATYWLGTAGAATATPLDGTDPANANKVCQQIGKALSATELRTDDYGFVIL